MPIDILGVQGRGKVGLGSAGSYFKPKVTLGHSLTFTKLFKCIFYICFENENPPELPKCETSIIAPIAVSYLLPTEIC